MKREITQKLVFNGATFKKRADFKNLIFKEDVSFFNATFKENVDFSDTYFLGKTTFKDAKIGTLISNNDQNQKTSIKLSRCVFEGNVDFSNVQFLQDVYFHRAIFKKDIQFYRSYFDKVANFYFATFWEVPNFSMCVFNNPKFANFVGMTLPFDSIDKLKEYIDAKVNEEQNNSETKEEKRKNGRTKTYLLTQHSLNIRDSFRVVKETLITQNNSLDSQIWHKMELYAKELEYLYRTDIESLTNEIRELEEKEKNQKYGTNSDFRQDSKEALELNRKNRIKNAADKWQLWFYRITSEHHTDLLKIFNNVILLMALFGMFVFGLMGIRDSDTAQMSFINMLSSLCAEQKISYFIFKDLNKEYPLELFWVSCTFFVLLYSWKYFYDNIALLCGISQRGVSRLLKYFCDNKDKIKIWLWIFVSIVFGYFLIKEFRLLEEMFVIFLICLVFVLMYLGLMLNRNIILTIYSYLVCVVILIIKPALLLPLFGKVFDESLKIDYPAINSLGVMYSILMFLLLFSLQKTARKNSIIPS